MALNEDMIGNPVKVRILRGSDGPFAWADSAVSRVASLFGEIKQ